MQNVSSVTVAVAASLVALCLGAGCGDDGGDSDEQTGTTTMGSSSGTSSTTTGTTTTTGSTTGTAGPTGTSGSTTVDTSGETTDPGSTDDSGSSSTGEPVERDWAALVLGTLYTEDLTMAQATHDAVAMGGQAAAMAAGDYGHDAMLGTTLLGTTEFQFMGIDQWDNLDGALATYGDPKFQAAFGMLFSRPPSVELFERRDDWHGWGDLEAADAGDRWFVVVRGRLAEEDLDAAQAMHDPLAAGGEEAAGELGDVAHVVWVGTPEDPQQFFAVDVWTDDSSIEAFYGDPMFQMAFGALFEAPPTISVYASTDWHQW